MIKTIKHTCFIIVEPVESPLTHFGNRKSVSLSRTNSDYLPGHASQSLK